MAEPGVNAGEASTPVMSIVLVASDSFASIRRTVAALQEQTIRGRLELILVGATEEALSGDAADELGGFADVRRVAVGPIDDIDRAAAAGIRVAAAPVVAIVEDHAFPDPDWAERLSRAHEGPWTAVGSAFRNANPSTALSWANLLLAYGLWVEPVAGGPTTSISRHNFSIKREALAQLGDELARCLGRDGGLLHRLRSAGGSLFLDGEARIRHLNPSRLGSTVALRIDAGRVSAATRARVERWSLLRRLAYVLAAPLFPLMRARLIRGKVVANGLAPRLYPALWFCLILDALGQALGFALGPGGARQRLTAFEVNRMRHLTEHDRRLFERE